MAVKPLVRTLCCVTLVVMASGALLAQELKKAPPVHSNVVIPYVESDSGRANVTIFSNLGTGTAVYNAAAGGYFVCGISCAALATDQWIALPFTNKVADHATQIQAAIGYDSGTKKVVLGIYTDNPGVGPGTLLVQGSTTTIPATGVCCQLAQVRLTPTALTANTKYWIVATSDDVAAPDFEGVWQPTFQSDIGGDVSNGGWFTFSGLVPAAAVKGTNP
jgi:hypothetical protein